MPAKHTSHEHCIFITDTSTTMPLWLNCKLHATACQMTPRIFSLTAYIQRRQGRWEEAIRNLERAIELDPRDLDRLYQIGVSYWGARRYAEEKSKLDRVLTIAPNDAAIKAERAFVELDWKADTGPLHQLIDEIRATNSAAMPKIASRWLLCALAERDAAAAKDALLASDEIPVTEQCC